MGSKRPVYYTQWYEDDMWLGYPKEFPDYWTQGKTEQELKENLVDIYKDLKNHEIPHQNARQR